MITGLWTQARALWKQRRVRRLLIAGAVLLSLAAVLLGLVQDWTEIRKYSWRFSWPALAGSSTAYAVALALAIAAWMGIMRGLKAPTHWQQDAKFYIYSWMTRSLPTPAPDVASRLLLYEEVGISKRTVSMALLWEQVLVIASGAVVALVLLPFTPQLHAVVPMAALMPPAVLCLVLVARPQLLVSLINHVLRRLKKQPIEQPMHMSVIGLSFLLYASIWVLGGMILFFLIGAIHPVEWKQLIFIMETWVVSGLVSSLLFFIPVNFGLREFTIAAMLSLVLPPPVALLTAVLARFWIAGNELLWALIIYKL